MLVINQKQVKKLVPLSKIKEVIDCVEQAFYDYGKSEVQMPSKIYLYFKKHNGDLRIMPSFSNRLDIAGTKIVNVHPDNPKKRLPTVMAGIILNDSKDGSIISFMDGTYITGMRTGAASAVSTKYLARKNAKTLGVIGAGGQSVFQIAAVSKVRNFKQIKVFDLNKDMVEKLKKILAKEKIKIEYADIEETVKSDVLITTTPSRKPIIKKEWILPGTHISAIGADAEGKEELDPEILKKAKIVIDDWAQASHSGEINVPLKKGIITQRDIHASLSEIVINKKAGRKDEKEVTVFDSTGLGIQDLYTAAIVYKKARKNKVGKDIEIV